MYDEYESGAVKNYVQKSADEGPRELRSSIPAEPDEDPAFNRDFDKRCQCTYSLARLGLIFSQVLDRGAPCLHCLFVGRYELFLVGPAPAAPPASEVYLREIRDLLAKR